LVAIQFGWIKNGGRGFRVGPILVHIGRNVKMDKHSEPQVHKSLLKHRQG